MTWNIGRAMSDDYEFFDCLIASLLGRIDESEFLAFLKRPLQEQGGFLYKDKLGSHFLGLVHTEEDPLVLALKSHLFVEAFIDDIIKSKFRYPKAILGNRDFTFSMKVSVLYSRNYLSEDLYKDILLLNNLRNKYAHNLSFNIAEFDVSRFKYCDTLANLETRNNEIRELVNIKVFRWVAFCLLMRLTEKFPFLENISKPRVRKIVPRSKHIHGGRKYEKLLGKDFDAQLERFRNDPLVKDFEIYAENKFSVNCVETVLTFKNGGKYSAIGEDLINALDNLSNIIPQPQPKRFNDAYKGLMQFSDPTSRFSAIMGLYLAQNTYLVWEDSTDGLIGKVVPVNLSKALPERDAVRAAMAVGAELTNFRVWYKDTHLPMAYWVQSPEGKQWSGEVSVKRRSIDICNVRRDNFKRADNRYGEFRCKA